MEKHSASAQLWLEQATDDLEVAEILLAHDPPKSDAAAYHFQQAAEKYLKAFLVYHGHRPPYTHNLEALLDLSTRYEETLQNLYDVVKPLAPYAVDIRYPGTDISATKEEAADALQQARSVRNAIGSRLPPSREVVHVAR